MGESRLVEEVEKVLNSFEEAEAIIFTGITSKSKGFKWSTSGQFNTKEEVDYALADNSRIERLISFSKILSNKEANQLIQSLIKGESIKYECEFTEELIKLGFVQNSGDKLAMTEKGELAYMALFSLM